MALMGCDCDAKECEYIRTADAGWTSMEQCKAALDDQIRMQSSASYPLITAMCQTQTPSGSDAIAQADIPEVSGNATFVSIADRPVTDMHAGVPVEADIAVATRTPLGYRIIQMPEHVAGAVGRAYDNTAEFASGVASRGTNWALRQTGLNS